MSRRRRCNQCQPWDWDKPVHNPGCFLFQLSSVSPPPSQPRRLPRNHKATAGRQHRKLEALLPPRSAKPGRGTQATHSLGQPTFRDHHRRPGGQDSPGISRPPAASQEVGRGRGGTQPSCRLLLRPARSPRAAGGSARTGSSGWNRDGRRQKRPLNATRPGPPNSTEEVRAESLATRFVSSRLLEDWIPGIQVNELLADGFLFFLSST